MNDEELLILLADQGCPLPEEKLRSELHYLRDWPEIGDGYIQLQMRAQPRTRGFIRESRITPRGINLVERMVPSDDTIAEF
jgi:hypothetical protein